ncbi:MAG: redoxin domain-containing protein [Planctomycetota bacterium]|jgi:hypothetical protein|nr:redoxin domain-containing protein [Planctomycetota bacterium]MDP6761272.1 redoxin domain-containing protein [Planctomycetota bacterium]MDP6989423.1 redoxin domain-containing protein [Planctomycetota bacterium]
MIQLIPQLVLLVGGAAVAPTPVFQDPQSAYFELEEAYEEAMADWREAVGVWRAARTDDPKLEPPASPTPKFYPRFLELADGGAGRAKLWCLTHFHSASARRGMTNRLRLCLDLVENHATETWAVEIVEALGRLASSSRNNLGTNVAFGLMDGIVDRNDDPDVKVNVLYNKGRSLERSDDEEEVERALGFYRTLRDEHPDHELARRATGFLFREENLQIGMRCPDFLSQDVDGNPVSLADYRGRVVVIDFWGFW